MKVNLWFARDSFEKIIEINNADKNNYYECPICNNEVIPKALNSKEVSAHFAHVDNSNCSHESMLHFWIKHLFIQEGEEFEVIADRNLKFKCKSLEVEKTYKLKSGTYKPDLVVTTECGKEIIFEIAKTNKKKIEKYLNKWIELNKIVVEVELMETYEKKFNIKTIYYKGINIDYYNESIEKVKKYIVDNYGKINNYTLYKLDYLCKILNNVDDIQYSIFKLLEIDNDKSFKEIMYKVLKFKCNDTYVEKINEKIYSNLNDLLRCLYDDYVIKVNKSNKRPYFITSMIIKINKNGRTYRKSYLIFNEFKKYFLTKDFNFHNYKFIQDLDEYILLIENNKLEDKLITNNVIKINTILKDGFILIKPNNRKSLLLFEKENEEPIEIIRFGAKKKKDINSLKEKLKNYIKEDLL